MLNVWRYSRDIELAVIIMALLALTACSGSHGQPGLTAADEAGHHAYADPGLKPIPGAPGLLAGLRATPDASAEVPLPKAAAQAGVDFASNRFIAIFDPQPQAQALAPYLDPGPQQQADTVRPTDNAPLVDHAFFRKVSVNLAAKYGLHLGSRVFYKDTCFAVYELPQVQDVQDLDATMQRVLNENRGLVREVCYDFFVHVCDLRTSPALPALPGGLLTAPQFNPAGFAAPSAAPAPAMAVNAQRPKTASTAPDYDNPDPYYVNHDSNDTANGRGTWGLWRIGSVLDQAWSYTTGSASVVVAVVDTGVRYTHEDLAANCIDPQNDAPYNAPGVLTDVINKDNDPTDGHGHGTFCAGEVGAQGNNGLGLAGVCWNVTILPVKVLSDSGYGTDAQVAEGMLLADYLGANIISMSLAGNFPDRTTQLAARQCNADGVLSCAASANENTSAPYYPGYYPECLCVGATTLVNSSNNEDFSLSGGALPVDTRFDARASFSDYGPWVDIAAPGVLSLSTSNSGNSNYAFGWGGTSMATPLVAGCAALLWSYISDPTNDKVRALLQGSSTQMDHLCNGSNPKGFIDNTTNGTVRCCNVHQALQLYSGGPYNSPTVSWDNPVNAGSVGGTVEVRLSVTPGDGAVRKVEFETPTHLIGVATAPDAGFYKASWDTVWEFNGPVTLTAKVYDDKANIVSSSITVTASNSHTAPPWTESFTGIGNNAIPAAWYRFDGNQGSGSTQWGAYDTLPGGSPPAAPALHTSGSTAQYANSSNDWVFAPVIDLSGQAQAALTFKRRYKCGSGDYGYFVVTADDINYTNYTVFDQTTTQDWTTVTVDLAAYAGRQVRLIWLWQADGGTTAEGLWLDDVAISSASGAPPTVVIDTPANGASVSGMVPLQLTLSDDVIKVDLSATPPSMGTYTFSDLPDNDPEHPTKTLSFNWDSRYIYNGGVLLTALAYDDENGNSLPDDFVARADVSLSAANPTRDPQWLEGFESITTLGGYIGNSFDGDWYAWTGGSSMWRIASGSAHGGSKQAKMGPSGAGNYSANEYDLLLSPVHNVSSATHPFLRLWHKLDVEADNHGDIAQVALLRYDGLLASPFTLAEYRTDTAPAGTWVSQAFNLAPYKSNLLRIEFMFTSDNDANAGAGWLIDDYEIIDADPQLTSLSPSRAKLGDTITINGSKFGAVQGASAVTFARDGGGRTNAAVSAWSDTAVQVVVPADAAKGDVLVDVLGYDSSPAAFTLILAPPALQDLTQR
jgi:thermitase